MSSAGQALGGLVGGVVGFFTPIGPLYGAQIGMMVGGYIDPPKGPTVEGPRLSDLTVQTSTYGAFIPRGYGDFPVVGNVFWLENNALKEVVKTKKVGGGKGGGKKAKQKTYTYYATFAVGLCEGPIAGVARIWIGGKLWYDARTTDPDAIRASNLNAAGFRVYLGTDTQDPDPRMQAEHGVNGTPAHRGLAYVVFYDLPLAAYGNSLLGAQVKVEVCKSASTGFSYVQYPVPNSKATSDITWGGGLFAAPATDGSFVFSSPNGRDWTGFPLPYGALTTPNVIGYCEDDLGGGHWVIAGLSTTILRASGVSAFAAIAAPVTLANYHSIAFGAGTWVLAADGSNTGAYSLDYGATWVNFTYPSAAGAYKTRLAYSEDLGLFVAVVSSSATAMWSTDGVAWNIASLPGSAFWEGIVWTGERFVVTSATNAEVLTSTDGKTWTSLGFALPSGTQWGPVATAGEGTVVAVRVGWGVAVSIDHGLTWTGHATTPGPWAGIAYGDGLFVAGGGLTGSPPFQFTVVYGDRLTSAATTLGDIIAAEAQRGGVIAPADLDVSAVTQPVRGYRVSSLGALRAGLEQLRAAWPFDVIASGYQIKVVPRGGASVMTIAESDLGAVSGDKAAPALVLTREMDSQIPARVFVSVFDPAREFDTGEQYAERLNSTGATLQALDLPIVLTADEAAQVAERLLYLYWMERREVAFQVPPSYAALEDADVVTLTAGGVTYSLRITSLHRLSDGRLDVRARYHDAAVYLSSATGAEGGSTGFPLALPGRTEFVLLDIPAVSSTHDQPSYLIAAAGWGDWDGCGIDKSADGGATWDDLAAVVAPGDTLGMVANVPGAGRFDIFDEANTLAVSLISGTLASASETAVLAGANHFAYGIDGRWEILAAKNCVLQSDGSYRLSGLLRGRFGTEVQASAHAAGDLIVGLDADLALAAVASSEIGLSRTFRATSIGLETPLGAVQAFTYRGVNLKCLSPCYAKGDKNPSSNDWTITWVRRTRVGGEWRDYVDATLSESTESYLLEFYDGSSYGSVKRSVTVSTAAATYTASEQASDFGGLQSVLYLKIYQISAIVGPGYPLTSVIGSGSVLLMHGDDTGLSDVYGHAVTLVGTAARSALQSRFGGFSAKFDGSAGGYLSVAYSSNFDFGTADFTVEAWVYIAADSTVDMLGGTRNATIVSNGFPSTVNDWSLLILGSSSVTGTGVQFSAWVAGTQYLAASSTAISKTAWHHIAAVRASGVVSIYVDGVPQTLTTNTLSTQPIAGTSPNPLLVGNLGFSGYEGRLNGYVDDLRISKFARYTSDFSAALPSAAFPE